MQAASMLRGWIGIIMGDKETLRGNNDFKIMLLLIAAAALCS